MRSQRMPIGHKEQAFAFMLQLEPVFEYTVIVPQMQLTGGAHA
jgi:hypothetical protein